MAAVSAPSARRLPRRARPRQGYVYQCCRCRALAYAFWEVLARIRRADADTNMIAAGWHVAGDGWHCPACGPLT